jgi:hypothetical protein
MWQHFKGRSSLVILLSVGVNIGSLEFLYAQGTAPVTQPATAPATQNPNAAPPPSKPPQRSTGDLEKLVAPIALYPDPLIATVLPASAYPLEIVQAARFVKDTNNIAKLDSQPWDANVKAVARIPQVISQMDENIAWTSDLGDAFINQPKALMDAIQTMRERAQASGALKTTPQQVVSTEQIIVTNFVQQQPIYVTNEVVQIEPAEPNVVYVPQYNPTVIYAGYPVAYPGYVYAAPYYGYYPLAATALTFGAGMAMGAWMANGCDWGHGGCWNGSYHSDVNINRDVNRNINRNGNRNTVNPLGGGNRQKWQADQNRLRNSGSTLSSAQSRDARGWGSGSRQTGTARQNNIGSTRTGAGSQARNSAAQNRRSASPSTGRQLSPTANRQGSTANRQSPSASTANRRPSQSVSRPSTSQRSAFNTSRSAPQTRQSSNRGNASRGISRGGGGGGRSFGGGGRGGGGGGRRR